MVKNRKDFLIAFLVRLEKFQSIKKLQKLIYLAGRAFGIKTGYTFRFSYYGPYSDGIMDDFDDLRISGKVSLINKHEYIYRIRKELIGQVPSFDADTQGKVDKLLNLFGNKAPSELQLYATVHFVDYNEKYLWKRNIPRDIIAKSHNSQPMFSLEQVEQAYNNLKEWGLLYQSGGPCV